MTNQHANPRKMRWQIALLLGAILVVGAFSACAPNAASDPLLAGRVNNSPISLAAYQRILAVYTTIDARQQSLDWQLPAGRTRLAGEQQNAFDFLVNLQLTRDQLRRLHIAVPQKNLDDARKALQASIDSQRQQLKQSPDPGTSAILNALTPDALDLYAEQEASQAALIDKLQVPTIHVRAIFVNSRDEAEKYHQQAVQGADFGQLAQKYSLDKITGAKGGDLGTIYVGEFSEVYPDFDAKVFAPGAHPDKFMVAPFRGNYALFEVTQPGTAALKSLNDPQFQQTVFGGWLQTVVRSQAKIERYVTLD
jgi:parvulin-like peptidyl-prolyl isomerase